MSFRRDKLARQQRRLLVVSGVAIGVFAGIFLIVGARPLVSTGYRVATPFWQLQHQFRERIAISADLALYSKKDLLTEIERLQLEAEAQEVGRLQTELLRRENENLRTALGFVREDEAWLVAGVLVRPPKTPYDIMILDVGSDQGVLVGQLVFSGSGTVLGVAQEVFARQAVVGLLSTPELETDVVLEKQGIGVTARGRGGGAYEMHVPRDIEVLPGDLIVLPGRQTELVGVVQDIIFDPRDPFQTVLASAPISFYEHRLVYVSSRTRADIPTIETVVVGGNQIEMEAKSEIVNEVELESNE